MSPEDIDRLVADLREHWHYIDIDKGAHYDADWRELVEDIVKRVEALQSEAR